MRVRAHAPLSGTVRGRVRSTARIRTFRLIKDHRWIDRARENDRWREKERERARWPGFRTDVCKKDVSKNAAAMLSREERERGGGKKKKKLRSTEKIQERGRITAAVAILRSRLRCGRGRSNNVAR